MRASTESTGWGQDCGDPRHGWCDYCAVRAAGNCSGLVGQAGRSFAVQAPRPRQRVLEAGKAIYHQGDPADWVFNLLSGWVCLLSDGVDGERHILEFVLPGDVFGLEPEDTVLGHSAVTLAPATVCAIRRSHHHQLRVQDPDFNERFLWLALREVRLAQDTLGAVAHGTAATRVAHLIWELTIRSLGRQPEAGDRVWTPITQVHIAQATGLTPIHVNRVLGRLRQQGVLDLRSQILTIKDPRGLGQLSGASEDMVALWIGSPAHPPGALSAAPPAVPHRRPALRASAITPLGSSARPLR